MWTTAQLKTRPACFEVQELAAQLVKCGICNFWVWDNNSGTVLHPSAWRSVRVGRHNSWQAFATIRQGVHV